MTRSMDTFTGKNVVIGCSATHHGCTHECHPHHSYYSINVERSVNPDLELDITAALPAALLNRFQVTFVENIDFDAYNDSVRGHQRRMNGKQGFQNMWNMTVDDGFIFIAGCHRSQEFRNSLQGLNYVEISKDYDGEGACVIIPKNQTLSIDQVNEQIHSNSELTSLIDTLNKINYIPAEHRFTFFTVPFGSLPTLGTRPDSILTEQLTPQQLHSLTKHKELPDVRALYNVIYQLLQLPSEDPSMTKIEANSINLFSKQLIKHADDFFKYDTEIVKRDIAIFQRKFALLINKNQPPLIKKNTDYLLIMANILIALTAVGAIVIGGKMIHSRMTTGCYLPLFFEAGSKQKLSFQAKISADKLAIDNQPQRP